MKRSEVEWSEMKWSEVKSSEVKWREVQLEKGERVSVEKVYNCSKGWEVKEWGEIVSELMIGKWNENNHN
jgi:hypothetical protein